MQGCGERQGWSLQEGSGSWALLTNFLICAVDKYYGSSFQGKNNNKKTFKMTRGFACYGLLVVASVHMCFPVQ